MEPYNVPDSVQTNTCILPQLLFAFEDWSQYYLHFTDEKVEKQMVLPFAEITWFIRVTTKCKIHFCLLVQASFF